MKKATSKQRLQFDFSLEALDRLDQLKEKTDASTRAEVVRNALKAYDWLVNENDANYIIKVEDNEGNIIYRLKAGLLIS